MFDLEPLEEMAGILLEFRGVLKSGGRLVLLNMSKSDDRPNLHVWIFRRLPSGADSLIIAAAGF